MENALLIGLSRQIALRRELETVANNIANLNTTGYKADNSVFEEFLMPGARHDRFQGADRRLSYVHDRATWHDFRPGPMQRTGNPLDVAIDGDAFLVVQTPRGERYTRNGVLQINATGDLVTSEGHQVLGDGGPIQFQTTDNAISINEDGSITAREGGSSKSDSARWCASIRSAGCRRTDRACFPRPMGSCRRRRRRFAWSRARSSNRTCAASSRWRAWSR